MGEEIRLEPIGPAAVTSKHRTAAVVLAGYCAFLQLFATQPLLPLLREVFHASAIAVSLTVTAPSLGVALAAPFAGLLADRIGKRRVIVWSAFLLALSALATSVAGSLDQLIFLRFWEGVFTPGVFTVTVAYINDEWRDAGAGRTVARYVSGTVLGGFSSRMISGLVAAHATWPRAIAVLGGLNLLVAVAVWAWLPPETQPRQKEDEGGWGRAVASHLRNRSLLAAFLVGFCVLFSLVGVFTYVTFYLAAAPFNLKPGALGSVFLVYLAGAAVTPAAGRAIDRFGHRSALAVAIVASIAGVALTLGSQLWIVALGLAVCCTGVFSAQASASSFLGVAAKQHRALAVGLYSTFYYLGGSAGAWAPGFFYSWGGWLACATFLGAVQAGIVMLALFFWKPM